MCVDFQYKLSGVTNTRQELTVWQIKSHFSIVCRFSLFSQIKNRRWQNFSLHQFVSKRVLQKDPGLPLQIWDAYYPPSTLGTTFCGLPLGGGARTGCRPSSSQKQKIDEFISCPAMAAALRGGATAMMAAQRGQAGLTTGGGV
jgi:hypothetical protein